MTGLGTIINSISIIAGGLVGHFTGKLFRVEQQEALKTLENDEFMWAIGENYQYVRMEENVEYPIIEVIHSREE